MVSKYTFTEVADMHVMFGHACGSETVAQCLNQDVLPLKFQTGKHFLEPIISCLNETDTCICSCRMRNADSQGNTGGRQPG
jgi:hypothetical protein